MTAAYDDEEGPIAYQLTDLGWETARDPLTLTLSEAVLWACVERSTILAAAQVGSIEAVKVGGRWLIDGESLREYLARPDRQSRCGTLARQLPAEPLVRQVELRGGPAACGVVKGSADEKALERARADGMLSAWLADRLVVRLLQLTVWDLWPDHL